MTQQLHGKLTYPFKPEYGSFPGFSLGFSLRIAGRVFEPVTVVAGFDDMAVMRQSVKQCCCHLFITKDIWPFNEAEIGGDNDAGTLIQLAAKKGTHLFNGPSS